MIFEMEDLETPTQQDDEKMEMPWMDIRKGGWVYDVFLSFRGKDTRYLFVSHLHAALSGVGMAKLSRPVGYWTRLIWLHLDPILSGPFLGWTRKIQRQFRVQLDTRTSASSLQGCFIPKSLRYLKSSSFVSLYIKASLCSLDSSLLIIPLICCRFPFTRVIDSRYLLILDRTNWKTNILTSLLIPYIFLSLPSLVFNAFRGEFGKWIAFIAVVLRLFFPRHFPEWLELPAALILLIVVAPSFFASTLRSSWVGVAICLVIACYLLQEHIRASGGFRNSFTKAHGISNTIGIIILLVYPIWTLVLYIV